MKKIHYLLIALVAMLMSATANAKTDIDFSSKFDEGTNTITATSSWGWYSVGLSDYEIADAEYLYIKYESTCNFNLVLRNKSYETAYSVTCKADETEGAIRIQKGDAFSELVIQNHSAGSITVKSLYFCTEDEYLNPNPQTLEEARENLATIYGRYQPLLDNFKPGTDFGCYPTDLVQAFSDALNAATVLDTEEGNKLTVDELNAISQRIVDTYKALVGAQIKYLPADGYYRFVCARKFQSGSDTEGYTYFTKAMYSTNTGSNGWKTVDAKDPTFLWTLKRQADDTYLLTNANSQLNFTEPTTCTSAEKYISIDPIVKTDGAYSFSWPLSTDSDVVVFNFRMSTEDADAYKYIHMEGHNGGEGTEGNMTVWCNTTNDSGASEWYLEPVDEAVAKEILGDNAYGHDFVVMLNDAVEKAAIANDRTKTKLITEASQFSSPYSQNDFGGADGGNLSEGVLIDGKTSTYWHSVWSNGSVDGGVHYLQIELPEEVTGDIEFDFSRRESSGDHVTKWGIYGSNNPDGEKYDYEWIVDLDTPYGKSGESITTNFTIDADKSYQYLRFYAEETNYNRGYWHVSEFQLYKVEDNPTNQAAAMGSVYTDLEAAIQVAQAVDQNNVTKADYEALKAAYDPFIALFVDPTPLRDAINAAEPALSLYVEGENPGEWSAATTGGLKTTIDEAKAYDKAGKYTQAETDAYTEALSDAESKMLASANKVSPDKRYAIHFASQELYEERGWSTDNVIKSAVDNLFDTYLCLADAKTLKTTPVDDARVGSYMFFTDDKDADIAFRFIPVGDDKYMIQHCATGLYVQAYGADTWTGMTLCPSLFTVEAIGYGENLIHATSLEGKDQSNLHAQLSDHRLVTWHSSEAGTNSGLMIEEIDDDTEIGTPMADFKTNEMTTQCYPLAVTPETGTLYTVAGVYNQNDKLYVALNKTATAKAGEPLVYVAPNATDTLVTVAMNAGTELTLTPLTDGALQGTFKDLTLTEEAYIFTEGQCQLSTEETSKVSGTQAYLPKTAPVVDAAGQYDLVIEVGGDLTGIQTTLASIAHTGNVYNTAGQLVRSGATLADVQRLPAGIYVFSGVKILVK